MGSLCATHANEIATADDFTAQQVLVRHEGPALGWLVDQWGVAHPLADNTTLGRDPDSCTFAVLHHTVSSLHAQLRREVDGWNLVDRGSLNGTFVAGKRIRNASLNRGDRVGLGEVSFFFLEDIGELPERHAGPGGTQPARQQDLSFSVVLHRGDETVTLAERPGGGVAIHGEDSVVELARLEFAILRHLAERRLEVSNPEVAYVASGDLAKKLDFQSAHADTDNVRELIRRVRKKLQQQALVDVIESRQGAGYRIGWDVARP